MDQPTSERIITLLEQLCTDLAAIRQSQEELLETLDSFTEEGFPLRSSIPTPEVIAAITASSVLLLREDPLTAEQIRHRFSVAQSLAKTMLETFDYHQSQSRNSSLESLLQR